MIFHCSNSSSIPAEPSASSEILAASSRSLSMSDSQRHPQTVRKVIFLFVLVAPNNISSEIDLIRLTLSGSKMGCLARALQQLDGNQISNMKMDYELVEEKVPVQSTEQPLLFYAVTRRKIVQLKNKYSGMFVSLNTASPFTVPIFCHPPPFTQEQYIYGVRSSLRYFVSPPLFSILFVKSKIHVSLVLVGSTSILFSLVSFSPSCLSRLVSK